MKWLTLSTGWTACVAALFFTYAVEPAVARTWTDTQGRKVEAEFAGVKNGVVQLKTESGKIQSVPIEQLSSQDRKFVAVEIGAKPAEPAAAPQPAAPPAPEAAPNPAEASDRFSEVIRQNPNSAEAYYQRGLSRLNRGNAKESLADFDQALKLDPKSAEAYDGRGQAHSASGDPVAAAKDFDKAIELKPGLASAYQHRGDNLKELGKSPAGKEMVDEKIEAYRRMYDAARDKQMTDKAWQPLNSTTGPTTRAGMIGALARVDYEKAKELEAGYRAGKGGGGGSGIGSGYGSGKGPGPGKGTAMGPAPRKGPNKPMQEEPSPESSPSESESGVVVIPEKVAKGENVVLVADPDKLAAGLPHEAQKGAKKGAETGSKQGAESKPGGDSTSSEDSQLTMSAASSKGGKPSSYASKKEDGKPTELASVDFYRDKDGDGKLDTKKDELLASDAEPQDGYSAEVSTANFPVGKQKYFAAPKLAPSDKSSEKKKSPAGTKPSAEQSPGEGQASDAKTSDSNAPDSNAQDSNAPDSKASDSAEKSGASKPSDEFQPAEPVALVSAAVSGTGEVVEPEQMASAEENSPAEKGSSPGKGKGKGKGYGKGKGRGGKGGGSYVGPRDSEAAQAIERAIGYAGRHEYGPAITEYNNLLTDYVDDPYYLAGRAGVHLAHGGYDLAIRDYDRLIEVETPTAEIYYNRGCAQLSVGNLTAAIADFSASLKLDELGKFANLALNNRGTAYARQGRFDLALIDFESAIKLNPSDAVAYRNRSLALRKLGRISEADADLAKAKQLGVGA